MKDTSNLTMIKKYVGGPNILFFWPVLMSVWPNLKLIFGPIIRYLVTDLIGDSIGGIVEL